MPEETPSGGNPTQGPPPNQKPQQGKPAAPQPQAPAPAAPQATAPKPDAPAPDADLAVEVTEAPDPDRGGEGPVDESGRPALGEVAEEYGAIPAREITDSTDDTEEE